MTQQCLAPVATTTILAHTVPLSYTVTAACERLSVSRTTLYELLKQGEIRSFKVGNRTLIPDSDLRAFVAKRLEAA